MVEERSDFSDSTNPPIPFALTIVSWQLPHSPTLAQLLALQLLSWFIRRDRHTRAQAVADSSREPEIRQPEAVRYIEMDRAAVYELDHLNVNRSVCLLVPGDAI